MSAIVVQLADALVAHLTSETVGGMALPAERTFNPKRKLPELKDLWVPVVPRTLVMSKATRRDSYRDYTIDVGIFEKLKSSNDAARIEELLQLVEAIDHHLEGANIQMDDGRQFMWTATANDPMYDRTALDEESLFASVLTMTYRTMRAEQGG